MKLIDLIMSRNNKEFTSYEDAMSKIMNRMRADGFHSEMYEGRIKFESQDIEYFIRISDSPSKNGTIRVNFECPRGATDSENVATEGLCLLANHANSNVPDSKTIWTGYLFVTMYSADVSSVAELGRVRVLALDTIEKAMDFLGEYYPYIYEQYHQQKDGQIGDEPRSIGFALNAHENEAPNVAACTKDNEE